MIYTRVYTIFMNSVQETLSAYMIFFFFVKFVWVINQQLYSENS